MIGFIDESGDIGFKINQGSSKFFVITLVLFRSSYDSTKANNQIKKFKLDLGLKENYELHFNNNSDRLKMLFINQIKKLKFKYFSVVIDKSINPQFHRNFSSQKLFYNYACSLLISEALPYLKDCTLVLDKTGSPIFRKNLKEFIKLNFNVKTRAPIKNIKEEDSTSNNLIQLADYICGISNRKMTKKKYWEMYYNSIKSKELGFDAWPK